MHCMRDICIWNNAVLIFVYGIMQADRTRTIVIEYNYARFRAGRVIVVEAAPIRRRGSSLDLSRFRRWS